MFGGPDEIRPGVYLGGFLSLEACQRLGIGHVLSVLDLGSYEQIKEDVVGNLMGMKDGHGLDLFHIDVEDRASSNLLEHMDAAVKYIGESLEDGGKVLVHCMAGVSRSATLVAAHIVKTEGLDPEAAIADVKAHRECVNPNPGFRKQLDAWNKMGNKVDEEHELYLELFPTNKPPMKSDSEIPREVPIVQLPGHNSAKSEAAVKGGSAVTEAAVEEAAPARTDRPSPGKEPAKPSPSSKHPLSCLTGCFQSKS